MKSRLLSLKLLILRLCVVCNDMVLGWGLSAFGIFLVGWGGVVFFCFFCFVRYKYTSSFQSMLMNCQDKNCFIGLINIEDRATVCEKGSEASSLWNV